MPRAMQRRTKPSMLARQLDEQERRLLSYGIDIRQLRDVGRPSNYDPRLCYAIVEWTQKTGQSLTAFAGAIGTSRHRLNEWAKRYPEFRDAMEKAKAMRALVLEKQVMQMDKPGPIHYRVLALKNCAPEDFKETTDVRHGGLPGAPPITSAQVDVSKLTIEQQYQYILNGAPLPVLDQPQRDEVDA